MREKTFASYTDTQNCFPRLFWSAPTCRRFGPRLPVAAHFGVRAATGRGRQKRRQVAALQSQFILPTST